MNTHVHMYNTTEYNVCIYSKENITNGQGQLRRLQKRAKYFDVFTLLMFFVKRISVSIIQYTLVFFMYVSMFSNKNAGVNTPYA